MLKIPILRCLFLIGGGYQLNDQYGPATGMARAFRNGITLDDRPNNEGVRAYFVKFGIFGKKCLKTKSPWKGPPWTFLGKLNGTRWYVWMVLRDFCQKIKTSWRRWPGYRGIAQWQSAKDQPTIIANWRKNRNHCDGRRKNLPLKIIMKTWWGIIRWLLSNSKAEGL